MVPRTPGAHLEAGETDVNKSLRYSMEELGNNTQVLGNNTKYLGNIPSTMVV